MKTIYLISVCCVCHKVMGKVHTTAYKEDVLSHGLCPFCAQVEMEKLEILKKSLDTKKK